MTEAALATNPADDTSDSATDSAVVIESDAASPTAMDDVSALEASHPAPAVFKNFSGGSQKGEAHNDIELIMDIPVSMTVELGRTRIAIKNLLQLAQGSVIELDGMAGEPLRVLVNGCLLAQGEVVVVNDKLGIRLTDIIAPSERIQKLNR